MCQIAISLSIGRELSDVILCLPLPLPLPLPPRLPALAARASLTSHCSLTSFLTGILTASLTVELSRESLPVSHSFSAPPQRQPQMSVCGLMSSGLRCLVLCALREESSDIH